MKTEKNVT